MFTHGQKTYSFVLEAIVVPLLFKSSRNLMQLI